MRIHRILLRDFRGVGDLDVRLDPAGVTVVEGRNEIGKTSIGDAFVLLLDAKDSSSARAVKEAQPIGRDVGPFVEAELAVGPYRLVYRKQWLKGRLTELEILAPRPEQLTGDRAHNRMNEILAEHTDEGLFLALRYQQGKDIEQAAVGQARSLVAALDAAAGGPGRGLAAGQDALFERVEQERLRFFTATGKKVAARAQDEEELASLDADALAIAERIRGLEEMADRQRQVERDLSDLQAELPAAARQIEVQTAAVRAVEEVERRAERARFAHERAQASLREAAAAHEARERLSGSAARAADALARLEAEIGEAEPAVAAAEAARAAQEEARAVAAGVLAGAEEEAASRRRTAEVIELRFARDQLRDRSDRAAAAEEAIRAADAFLAGCAATEALVREIDEAAEQLAVARGRAEAGSARVVVELLREAEVTVNGERRAATPSSPVEEMVTSAVEVVIGDLARVVVSPPATAGVGAQDDGQAVAGRRLAELLAVAGVASAAEARELARQRSLRETERESARQRRADALGDLDASELAAKLGRAEERLRELTGEGEGAVGGDERPDVARGLVDEAEARVREARSVEERCRTQLDAAEAALQVLESTRLQQRARLDGARAEAERAARELAEQRVVVADEAVVAAVAGAEAALATAEAERVAAERDLGESDPATVRALLENAQALHGRIGRDVHAREVELAAVGASLSAEGHDGLADRLADVLARAEEVRRRVEAAGRQAAAVELLHRVLAGRREQAQRAYAGPFRDKVNAYARILHGPGVEVEVDHSSLAIVSRTLGGTTVPFEALSGGAREQLAVLARLACAALVSPPGADGSPGGVPVVIDDALGYSDPERLERLGAAFGVAGRDCQVIVLTCEPGRYRGVGGATVVSLG